MNGDHLDLNVLAHSFPKRLSSDLPEREDQLQGARAQSRQDALAAGRGQARGGGGDRRLEEAGTRRKAGSPAVGRGYFPACGRGDSARPCVTAAATRSEEHTSELQSLMRNPYAVFGLQKKTN